jgi:hypothetical protein
VRGGELREKTREALEATRPGETEDKARDPEVGEKAKDARDPRSALDAPQLRITRRHPLSGVRHVDEHHSRDFLGMPRTEKLCHEAAVGMTHENVGRLERETL